MLNTLWLGMIFLSVIFGAFTGHLNEVVLAVTDSAKLAFELALGLAGILTFWLGIMEVAKESGLVTLLARVLHRPMKYLFPDVPEDDPAMGAMILNITANMLGLSNAATPFGLQAMKELERLNPHPGEATDAMCVFLAINTSSVQLIPTTAIAYLATSGCTHPTEIIASALIATSMSTIVAITVVKQLAKWKRYRIMGSPS
ncbi:MAG: nucleoside recognition protein [Gammaproteobacteria bacterium]|nr:nucleoside recognition protein [Gammaproteobacteria bacterium]